MALILWGGALFAEAVYDQRGFLHDDAYIVLRYARNLMDGYGLVWNPGGERVEGFTSLAAALGVSALGGLGIDLVAAARGLNFAAIAGIAGYLAVAGARRVPAGPSRMLAGALPAVVGVVSTPLIAWAWGGLEGPLYAFALVLAAGTTASFLERPESSRLALAAGATLGMLTAVRPDGAAFLVVGCGFVAAKLRGWPVDQRGQAIRFAVAAAVVPICVTAFRLIYYGAWVPNTVVAKTWGVPLPMWQRGFEYLWEFTTAAPFVPLLALAGFVASVALTRARTSAWFLLACFGVYAGLVARAGGDHMAASRLCLPLIPLAGLLVSRGFAAALQRSPRAVGAVASVCVAALLWVQHEQSSPLREDPAAYVGTLVGQHIRSKWEPGTVIALSTGGSTPFFAGELTYIDMLGLNDRHIARRVVTEVRTQWQKLPGHAKGDGDYVLGRAPDVIIIGPAHGRPVQRPWFLSDLELRDDPRFHSRYQLHRDLLDVRDRPGYPDYPATRSGELVFTYYLRRDPGLETQPSS